MNSLYTTKNISVTIGIPSHNLGNDIESIIKEKAKKLVISKELNNIGFIYKINKINSISGGEILLTSGVSRFNVFMSVILYAPVINAIIKTKVSDVSMHGYHVQEPIEMFVGTNDNRPTVKTGDIVNIKITKISFNKGKFIVIAIEEQ
jgi:DNA-directed RNA polymerase subunit E'/Rpb7